MDDKLKKYFDSTVDNNVEVSRNMYSLGLELEFKTKTPYMTRKYKKCLQESNGFGNWLEDYNRDVDAWNTILGLDGCSTTQEFRSPVFVSEKPEDAFSQLAAYVVEVKDFLRQNFKALFAPYLFRSPIGLHFSLGGKYLTKSGLENILEVSRALQPELIHRLSDEDKVLYTKREKIYSGKIGLTTSVLKYSWSNTYEIQNGDNAIRSDDCRVELRYFPSCDVETIFPYLETIAIGKKIPSNLIKFIKD